MLVALLLPEHEHHTLALGWFGSEATTDGWATCAVTELGAIRVCVQLSGGVWSPETLADRLLVMTTSSREYVWWPDTVTAFCDARGTGRCDRTPNHRPLSARPRAPQRCETRNVRSRSRNRRRRRRRVLVTTRDLNAGSGGASRPGRAEHLRRHRGAYTIVSHTDRDDRVRIVTARPVTPAAFPQVRLAPAVRLREDRTWSCPDQGTLRPGDRRRQLHFSVPASDSVQLETTSG